MKAVSEYEITMSEMAILKSELVRDEGYRSYAYKDTVGVWTGGVGHNLMHENPYDIMRWTRESLPDPISDEQIGIWFDQDIKDAIKAAINWLEWDVFFGLTATRKRVVINMAFNLGAKRIKGFKNLRAAIQRNDYANAAFEMNKSKWYRQVKGRADRLIMMMLGQLLLTDYKKDAKNEKVL